MNKLAAKNLPEKSLLIFVRPVLYILFSLLIFESVGGSNSFFDDFGGSQATDVCGDGVKQASEECDYANLSSQNVSCSVNGHEGVKSCNHLCRFSLCKLFPYCGDGVLNQPTEECDPPEETSFENVSLIRYCNNQCKYELIETNNSSNNTGTNETIEETGSISKSTSPDWWVNSGAYFIKEGGVGKTVQGELPLGHKWQIEYANSNPVDTDNGTHPQNIFRLFTRTKWQNLRQEAYFKVVKDQLSSSPNRAAYNGLVLVNRYIDSNNFYYAGLRVDGAASIKKKFGGTYYTLGSKKIFSGTYNKNTNPNLLPKNTWIGIRNDIKNNSDGTVNISLYMDNGRTGNWQLLLSAKDTSATGGGVIGGEGYGGFRTDFIDIEFDDYKMLEFAINLSNQTNVSNTTPLNFSGGIVSLNFDDGYLSVYKNAIPILNAAGLKSTQFINSVTMKNNLAGYMNTTHVLALWNGGHEIGGHTRTHAHLFSLSEQQQRTEIINGTLELRNLGMLPADVFAYPFNEHDSTIEAIAAEIHIAARTTEGNYNTKTTNKYLLKSRGVDVDISASQVKGWIDTALANKQWLVLVFHKIENTTDFYSTTPQTFSQIVDYLVQKNVTVVTMKQGIAWMSS